MWAALEHSLEGKKLVYWLLRQLKCAEPFHKLWAWLVLN